VGSIILLPILKSTPCLSEDKKTILDFDENHLKAFPETETGLLIVICGKLDLLTRQNLLIG